MKRVVVELDGNEVRTACLAATKDLSRGVYDTESAETVLVGVRLNKKQICDACIELARGGAQVKGGQTTHCELKYTKKDGLTAQVRFS